MGNGELDNEKLANDFSFFLSEFKKESDRGSVIVAAALLDDSLARLIQTRLVTSPERDDELFVGANAPLNSFSSKINFAYRLGVIRLSIRSSLHLIRKLRNEFSHSSFFQSFSNEPVQDRVRELFKLNKILLISLVASFNEDESSEMSNVFSSLKQTCDADKLVQIMGWRWTFEILAATTAAALHQLPHMVEPLDPLDE
jgi:DNA-binding MltR family transcriptional regulator